MNVWSICTSNGAMNVANVDVVVVMLKNEEEKREDGRIYTYQRMTRWFEAN